MKRSSAGFVLAPVLVLLGLGTLLAVQALAEAAASTALATRLQLRQRAFDAAESALAVAAAALERSTAAPADLRIDGDGPTTVHVRTHLDAVDTLPLGFSAGRFRTLHLTLNADASAARGTRLGLASGWARREALP